MPRRRLLSSIAALVLAGLLVAGILLGSNPLHPRSIGLERVRALKLLLYDAEGPKEWRQSITAPDKIAPILSCLSSAEKTHRHHCAGRAMLTFVLADGREVEVQILPGHSKDYYEYRCHGERSYYRMRREQFVAVMAGAGIKREWLLRPFDENPPSATH